MSEATEKQIKFAKSLGIDSPENYTKEALRKLIDEKMGNKTTGEKKPYQNASQSFSNTSKHDVVVTRTEKPHSFEFGKAGARHKVYYETIEELKSHIASLKEAGLYDDQEIKGPRDVTGEY